LNYLIKRGFTEEKIKKLKNDVLVRVYNAVYAVFLDYQGTLTHDKNIKELEETKTRVTTNAAALNSQGRLTEDLRRKTSNYIKKLNRDIETEKRLKGTKQRDMTTNNTLLNEYLLDSNSYNKPEPRGFFNFFKGKGGKTPRKKNKRRTIRK
jgi:hypothetical protein